MVNLQIKSVKASPSKSVDVKKESNTQSDSHLQTLLWVDKYKPTTFNKIIGMSGEKSNANKLLNWLKNWQKFQLDPKVKKSWNDQETGSSFKGNFFCYL